MAHLSGKTGDIRYRKFTLTSTGVSFATCSPNEIRDSNNGFTVVTAADYVTVSGSTSNNDTYLVASVGSGGGTLVLDGGESLTEEAAGDTVIVQEALPGTQLVGFSNWTLDMVGEALETTDFGDVGRRTYVAGLTSWSATADRYWCSASLMTGWTGASRLVRFFERYDATPNTTNAYYIEGNVIVSGISTNTPVDGVVTDRFTMQGTGTATASTRTLAWPT